MNKHLLGGLLTLIWGIGSIALRGMYARGMMRHYRRMGRWFYGNENYYLIGNERYYRGMVIIFGIYFVVFGVIEIVMWIKGKS
jgi:hypothetical protein